MWKGYDFIEIKLNGMRDVLGANWGKLHECPTGSFIDGFDVAYHPLIGMTSISAECADKDGNTVGSVRSLVCPVKSFLSSIGMFRINKNVCNTFDFLYLYLAICIQKRILRPGGSFAAMTALLGNGGR